MQTAPLGCGHDFARSRLSGRRQRQHDPPGPCRWLRRPRRQLQALVGPPAEDPEDPPRRRAAGRQQQLRHAQLTMESHAVLDAGSFRDPDSRVFYADGAVLRALSDRGLEDWRALAGTRFFAEALAQGQIVATEEAQVTDDLPLLRTDRPAGVLRHERIPFVSYPYEWTPGMLRDAALLQLDLFLAALDEDVVIKDATPYNVQFHGAKPVFVDVGSFEPLREGEPWVGYRQFCELFLYPLMLAAWKDVPYAPWLRGSLEGIRPSEMRDLLSFRDRFRKGTTTHVFLHARLERSYAARGRTGGDVRQELKRAGFNKQIVRANVAKMRKLVGRLEWQPPKGVWTEYRADNSYTDDDTSRKLAFVTDVASSGRHSLVW